MIDDLNNIVNWESNDKLANYYKIVLCFPGRKPIAISFFDKKTKQLSTFVRLSYRNRGIAKEMTKLQKIRYFWIGDGNKHSVKFANSVKSLLKKKKLI